MAANTAERILDAGEDLLRRRGYHAFSYRDIAARVGIRTASIHYYFPSKGDLVEAVLARARMRFEAELERLERQVPGVVERLAGFVRLFAAALGDGDRLCPFCVAATTPDALPPAARAQLAAFWRGAEDWLAAVLAEGRATGELVFGGTAEDAAVALVAMLEGAAVAARALDAPQRPAAVSAWALATLGAAARARDAVASLSAGVAGGS